MRLQAYAPPVRYYQSAGGNDLTFAGGDEDEGILRGGMSGIERKFNAIFDFICFITMQREQDYCENTDNSGTPDSSGPSLTRLTRCFNLPTSVMETGRRLLLMRCWVGET